MNHDQFALILCAAFAFAFASDVNGREPASLRAAVDTYCLSCHDGDSAKGGLNLASASTDDVGGHPEVWEKVVRRLQRRQMPPAGRKRPDEVVYISIVSQLETALDRAAAERPNPGRTDTIRRLNRTEYQ